MNNNFNKPRSIINKEGLEDSFKEIEMSSPEKLRANARIATPELYKNEIPLNDKEKQAIKLINKNVSDFAKKYTENTFPVMIEDVHKVPYKTLADFMDNEHISAVYHTMYHQVFFSEREDTALLYSHIQHEVIHGHSLTFFKQELEGNNKKLDISQNGVMSNDGEYLYFENLNEAITESISKKISQKQLQNTVFKKNQNDLVDKLNSYYALAGLPIHDSAEVVSFEVRQTADSEPVISLIEHTYKSQRLFFDTLLEDIKNKKSETYTTKEQVEDIFFKAYFTGNFTPMEIAINETYGPDTIKKLKLIDRRKLLGTPNLQKKGNTLIALIESIKSDSQS